MCNARLHMQVSKGENTLERPMWAEKGGLDFDGRAKWDAWTAVKGLKPEKAKLNFVKVMPCPQPVPGFSFILKVRGQPFSGV